MEGGKRRFGSQATAGALLQDGAREDRDEGRSRTVTALRAGSRAPSGPGLRCHVTTLARRARAPEGSLRRRRRTGVT